MEENTRLTKEKFTEILQEVRMDYKWGVLRNSSDISDYEIYDGETFGLPLDIAIDNNSNFQTKGLPYHIYFRNSYNRNKNEWIALKIDNNPHFFGKPILNVAICDIYRIKLFVKRYQNQLIKIANEEITNFRKILGSLNETKELITEMAILHPEETGLSRKIWVDNGGTYKEGGHWIRVKVENPKGEKNSRGWSTFKLGDMTWGDVSELDINTKERNEIERFIKLNLEVLTLATIENWSSDQLKEKIIKIDSKSFPKEQERPEYKEWAFYKPAGFDINIVKHNIFPDRFNFEKDGKILFTDFRGIPYQFDSINPYNKKGLTYVTIGGEPYWGNTLGTLTKI